jgi:anhydro-N-acetylmuramic acid kinase
MSGTSLDGVDAAIIKSDGYDICRTITGFTKPFPEKLRSDLRKLIAGENTDLLRIEREFTLFHAEIVNELLQKNQLSYKDIDLVGFHGQTIIHRPAEAITQQIGDGSLLAHLTKINVVNDFRRRDMAAGGQGAPLAPLYHKTIVDSFLKPVMVVNIGGVSNVTYIDEDQILAFDTGPGCALIDDFIWNNSKIQYDEGGKIARTGKVNQEILDKLLSHEFFKKSPPKSLDRNEFSSQINLSLADGLATLTAFTAKVIAMSSRFLSKNPVNWFVAGGGRHNDYLMELISKEVMVKVMKIDELSIDGDLLEAQAFAYLAIRSYLGLSLSLPATTGVSSEVSGGAFYRA